MTDTVATQKNRFLLKHILRPLVPKPLLQDRGVYQRLGPRAGRIYLRLRVLDLLGIRRPNKRLVPPDARSFLFVCYGNIMRSPMARILFEHAARNSGLTQVSATSAGLHANPGTYAHPHAQVAARALGFPLDRHRSRLLTPEMVSQAHAIFAMDFQNKAELLALYPAARAKIFMLSAYADGKMRFREISDPYFGGQEETYRCYAALNTCVQNLVKTLSPPAVPVSVPKTSAVHWTKG